MSRFFTLFVVLLAVLVSLAGGLAWRPWAFWGLAVAGPLALVGLWDLVQRRHSLLRNYPLLAHLRWLFEGVRPEIRQYLMESDKDAVPFSRDQRSIVYQRAKDIVDKRPFGTELDVYAEGHAWLNHSMAPAGLPDPDFRVSVGGPQCDRPFVASVLNISAMSFGSLGANAIRALNRGARAGGFAHDTGEGGISRHHLAEGGDLIWEIGTGYFGCRDAAGGFEPSLFAEQAALEQVRMIEIKISQGAKPGHGGVLPGAKVTAEIAGARGIPVGQTCVSPPGHSAFATPREMMAFIARLRELSGGKPVGFKLCIGQRHEFMAICRAMVETGIRADFVVIDGAEGGTGAAPLEFTDHVGTPLHEGLVFARDALVASGLRADVRLAASGKIVTAFDMVRVLATGADWCNAARGFMFALGCIQAQACHTNRCPVGVTTQDPLRQRALAVADKARRVANFHRNTLESLAEVLAAAGVAEPAALEPRHLSIRGGDGLVRSGAEIWPVPVPGVLVDGGDDPLLGPLWREATADSFAPRGAPPGQPGAGNG